MTVVFCSFQFQANGFEEGFWSGAWAGTFQLVTLAVVAFFVNILYRRYRELAAARQELINEIDQFTIRLYKPRKAYQRIIDGTADLLTRIPDPDRREAWRVRRVEKLFEEYLQAVGRFRALQVKIVPLFGNHLELFAHYLAIWRYLKEIRQRMEKMESLFFHHESPESADAFYRLIDSFRYLIAVEKARRQAPGLVRPPQDVLSRMRTRGDEIYANYFKQPATKVACN